MPTADSSDCNDAAHRQQSVAILMPCVEEGKERKKNTVRHKLDRGSIGYMAVKIDWGLKFFSFEELAGVSWLQNNGAWQENAWLPPYFSSSGLRQQ